jgi:hypothetical protein
MTTISVLTKDAIGECQFAWFDSFGDAIPYIREFRALNDYADNARNGAFVDVCEGDRRLMFWSAAKGFVGRSNRSA